MYIGDGFLSKTLATAIDILLALATLGDMTQIGTFLSLSLRPRWPRQVHVCCCCMSLSLTLLRYLCQCKYGFTAIKSFITLVPRLFVLHCSQIDWEKLRLSINLWRLNFCSNGITLFRHHFYLS